MSILLGMFALGLLPCWIVWMLTRRTTLERAVTLRALTAALFLCPTLAASRGLHAAFPVPTWFMLLWGPGEVGASGTAAALIPGVIAFFVLRLVLRDRLSQ